MRWDLNVGPLNQDLVIALPANCRFSRGELRSTISKIRSQSIEKLKRVMNDQENWVGLISHFDYEVALSGYIAAYPHRLEDGLETHPNDRVRERVFRDRTRADLLLLDRSGRPVVVECKQGSPTVDNLKQLRHYLDLLKEETGEEGRGILVHGGSRNVRNDVLLQAKAKPVIEMVQHKLDVEFMKLS